MANSFRGTISLEGISVVYLSRRIGRLFRRAPVTWLDLAIRIRGSQARRESVKSTSIRTAIRNMVRRRHNLKLRERRCMAEPDASTIPFVERMPRPPLVWNNHSMAWISDRVAGIVEHKAPRWWWVAIAISSSFAAFGTFCIIYLLFTGVGVWGNNIPVGWAWGITNFVFWIGIGHAGTLISAILHLCRQKWRTRSTARLKP